MLSDADENHYNPSTRLIEIEKNGPNCGFQLTRSKWDPYPWVSSVDPSTPAEAAGLKPGDCILEVNGEEIIGQKIAEIAEIVKSNQLVSLLLWNAGVDPHCTPEAMCCGPMPTNLQRLSACMSTILAFLECPVCLDTIPPPTYQCENGHLICIRCRTRSERCPICRSRYGRGRSLMADQVYNSLVDAFHLREETSENRNAKMQEIFKFKNKIKQVPDIKITPSHTSKFLARVVGKSSSVDNLSIISGCNLKIKSLSNQELFQDESPVMSRASSVTRLSRNEKNKNCLSASCHGSFESLHKNPDEEISFHCPFSIECTTLIKGHSIIEHFRLLHDGPLVQYFKPHITITYKKILENQSLCYVIYIDRQTFFLKVEIDEISNNENVLLWTWLLGPKKDISNYEMKIKVLCGGSPDPVITTYNNVFSLSAISYQEVKDLKRGTLLGLETLQKSRDVCLEVDILRSDDCA